MKWKLGLYRRHLGSISFRDTMVPNYRVRFVISSFWGIVFSTRNKCLTRFNHQRTTTHFARKEALKDETAGRIGQVPSNKAREARAVGQV